ncbi:MAG: hypothetical protein JWO63_2248, partial [Frankiales bacterium]|nr:hypothetical protein [Frankiales bacterium]
MRVDNLVTAYIEIEHLNAPQGRPAG